MIKIKRPNKLESHSHSWIIIVGLLVLLMWIISCKTIQSVDGFKDYPKNTLWNGKGR